VLNSLSMARRKNPNAVALGRRGGKAAAGAGLRSWYDDMTKEERRTLAQKAAATRWAKARARKKA